MGEVQDKNEEENSIARARQLLADGALEESLAVTKAYWLAHPDDAQGPAMLSELMKEAGRSEISSRLDSLAKVENNDSKENPKELFEAGFALIDVRQHELAAMLLNRCVQLVPEEPTVNYELGFALMSLRRYPQAIPYFEIVAAKAPDFDTFLNLAACYTMTRRLRDAHRAVKKISHLTLDDEQSLELAHRKMVLRRLESVSDKEELSLRDWLYVLYGSILLRPGKRDEKVKEDPASIGATIAVLKGLLEGMGIELEVIEFYGPQSRPLARAIAELLEIPFDSYKGPDRPERALLTMTWASDIIGPHRTFMHTEERRALFSYGITWDEPLPLVPDIVGCLAYEEPIVWQTASSTSASADGSNVFDQEEFDNRAEAAYKSILYNARDLESDPTILQRVQEALDYYKEKAHLLTLCNGNTFPHRSEYTAELE